MQAGKSSEGGSDKISIFLSVDMPTLKDYFNAHDPAPIYKRQLSHQLEQYIGSCVQSAKRHSAIFYKIKCTSEIDKQYAEPLMYAIRRHYDERKETREKEFKKFKIRNWTLLAISITVVLLFQGFLPLLLDRSNTFHNGLGNSLDIFSWVLLWRPIDVLLFAWNPHLKDICLLNKLATAEVILIES
jgi:hypothetical protein